MSGQSKKMVVKLLSLEQRKKMLKWYWKFENVAKYIDSGGVNSQRINNCTHSWQIWGRWYSAWCSQLRSGRYCTTTRPSSSAIVLEQFTGSPQTTAKQCAREIWISRSSVQPILKRASQGCYMPCMKTILIEECSFASGFSTRYTRIIHEKNRLV
jgi:hypothetical protein